MTARRASSACAGLLLVVGMGCDRSAADGPAPQSCLSRESHSSKLDTRQADVAAAVVACQLAASLLEEWARAAYEERRQAELVLRLSDLDAPARRDLSEMLDESLQGLRRRFGRHFDRLGAPALNGSDPVTLGIDVADTTVTVLFSSRSSASVERVDLDWGQLDTHESRSRPVIGARVRMNGAWHDALVARALGAAGATSGPNRLAALVVWTTPTAEGSASEPAPEPGRR